MIGARSIERGLAQELIWVCQRASARDALFTAFPPHRGAHPGHDRRRSRMQTSPRTKKNPGPEDRGLTFSTRRTLYKGEETITGGPYSTADLQSLAFNHCPRNDCQTPRAVHLPSSSPGNRILFSAASNQPRVATRRRLICRKLSRELASVARHNAASHK